VGAGRKFFTLPKGVAKPELQQTLFTANAKKEVEEVSSDEEVKIEEEPEDEVMADVDAEEAVVEKVVAKEKTPKKAGSFTSLVLECVGALTINYSVGKETCSR